MSMVGLGSTDVGKQREANEDAFLVDNDLGLYAVCDGMGGHAGGEVASTTAIQVISQHLGEQRALLERVRDGKDSEDKVVEVVSGAIRAATAKIYRLATSRRELAGMGTTATVLVELGAKAVMGHVGDSRLYLLRAGVVHRMSTDHTMVEQLVRSGAMTLEAAKQSHFAHVVTRAVGIQPAVEVDTLVLDVYAGDRLLLCTDGLTEYMFAGDELAAAMSGQLEEIPDDLVAVANERGGADNITAVCVHVDADDERDVVVGLESQPVMRLDTLDRSFLMNGLSLAQAQRVLNACEVRELGAGEVIVNEGDACAAMYLVVDGELVLSRRGTPVGTVAAGDTVGETALLRERRARARLSARSRAVVLCLPRSGFDGLVRRRPWLGMELLHRVTGRTCAAGDRLRVALERAGVNESEALQPGDLF